MADFLCSSCGEIHKVCLDRTIFPDYQLILDDFERNFDHLYDNIELKGMGRECSYSPYRSLLNYWQEPSKLLKGAFPREGSFERYERTLQSPLLICRS